MGPAVLVEPVGRTDNLLGPVECVSGCYWRPVVRLLEIDGAQGTEPPAWVKELRETAFAFAAAEQGSEEFMKLGARLITLNLDNMVIIGTAGAVPQINVVSNKLDNLLDWNLNAYRAGFAHSQLTDQWYFK